MVGGWSWEGGKMRGNRRYNCCYGTDDFDAKSPPNPNPIPHLHCPLPPRLSLQTEPLCHVQVHPSPHHPRYHPRLLRRHHPRSPGLPRCHPPLVAIAPQGLRGHASPASRERLHRGHQPDIRQGHRHHQQAVPPSGERGDDHQVSGGECGEGGANKVSPKEAG